MASSVSCLHSLAQCTLLSLHRPSSCSSRTGGCILQDVLLRAQAVHVQAALSQDVPQPFKGMR